MAIVLALVGTATWRRDAPGETPPPMTKAAWALMGIAALHLLVAIATLFYRRFTLDVGLFTIRITNIDQLIVRASIFLNSSVFFVTSQLSQRNRFSFTITFTASAL